MEKTAMKIRAMPPLCCDTGGRYSNRKLRPPPGKFVLIACLLLWIPGLAQGPDAVFKVGAAKRDITPKEPVPMWGYSSRHDALSEGVLDPLYAAALVIQAGTTKLAIVGL